MGTGTRDCFLSFFLSPRTERELKAKRGGVLGRRERGGGSLLHPFSFSFFPFSFLFFPFFVFSVFLRNETKRNETKLRGSYSSFMNDLEMSPKKRISDNLYIRNSTSFIDIIFHCSKYYEFTNKKKKRNPLYL